MADRCLEHPWGTCDRCGNDLQAQSACVPFGGYSTPCDPCVQSMLEDRRKKPPRHTKTRYFILEVQNKYETVCAALMTPADEDVIARMAALRQSVVISQGESEDADIALSDCIKHVRL